MVVSNKITAFPDGTYVRFTYKGEFEYAQVCENGTASSNASYGSEYSCK